MDDAKIIELCFARNEEAVRALEEKYEGLANSIAYNILQNREDAEECVNDTLNAVWNAIPPAQPTNLTAFVAGVAEPVPQAPVAPDKQEAKRRHACASRGTRGDSSGRAIRPGRRRR